MFQRQSIFTAERHARWNPLVSPTVWRATILCSTLLSTWKLEDLSITKCDVDGRGWKEGVDGRDELALYEIKEPLQNLFKIQDKGEK